MLRCFLWLGAVGFLSHARTWTDGEVIQSNGTDLHIARSAISDGELIAAQSGVTFDRRPAYINGKDPSPPNASPGFNEDITKADHTKEAMETQHTMCQVTTEQLVASAQATVTRVLKGLCTSKELETRFLALENNLSDKLNELKGVISNLEDRVIEYNEALRRGRFQQMETLFKYCDNQKSGAAESLSITDQLDSPKVPIADSKENETEPIDPSPRESEIQKFNSSISIEPNGHSPPKKVFTYYWRISEIRQKLTETRSHRSIRSSSFYVYLGGYRLYLRCFPRQNENNFFVHVGVTKGEFDEALKWPFSLKLRVNILDQTPSTLMYEDIASRTWDPAVLCSEFNWQKPTKGDNYECVGLGFPQDLLHHRKYIYNNAVIIKLSVYLES